MVKNIIDLVKENKNLGYNEITYKIVKKYHSDFIDEKFVIDPNTLPEKMSTRQLFLIFSPFMVGELETRKKLVKLISSIQVEEEPLLLCSGNGIIKPGCIMIVGMAPGFYNGNKFDLISSPFKPSFYFSNVSRVLRFGIKEKLDQAYFTNLSKVVLEKSKMDTKMYKNLYENFFKYLQKEINILKPKVIISLGKDVFEFLKERQIDTEKLYHPSYFVMRKQFETGKEYYKENLCRL